MPRFLFWLFIGLLIPDVLTAQLKEIKKAGEFSGSGMVEDIQAGEITIRSDSGKTESFLIQDKDVLLIFTLLSLSGAFLPNFFMRGANQDVGSYFLGLLQLNIRT